MDIKIILTATKFCAAGCHGGFYPLLKFAIIKDQLAVTRQIKMQKVTNRLNMSKNYTNSDFNHK